MIHELYLNGTVKKKKEKRTHESIEILKTEAGGGGRGKLFFTKECQLINSEQNDSIRKINVL